VKPAKIDIILTKSISRFARNTVDLLETVRHLKELGIEVRFEKEGINSLSGDGEVMLTLLASFAQEESISISNNVKWGIRKRMQAGMPNASGHFVIYGYRWEGDQLVVVPEEAVVVKRIFQNFLDGKSRLETEREFAAEGITTRQGCRWVDSNIKKILTNITYTGNMLFQKEFISDPIEKAPHGKIAVSCRSTMSKTHMKPSSTRKPSTMCRTRWNGGGCWDALRIKRLP
jgi:site-specific DNA recombinase